MKSKAQLRKMSLAQLLKELNQVAVTSQETQKELDKINREIKELIDHAKA